MKKRTKDQLFEDYCSFCAFLDIQGFELTHELREEDVYVTKFKNPNLVGYIRVDLNGDSTDNWKYSARIIADNQKCYNKESQCPFQMMLPPENKFFAYLRRMNYWGTREGYKKSNTLQWREWDRDVLLWCDR